MGHYRSEMISDSEIREEEKRVKARRKRILQRVRREIKKRGLEEVLVDMIEEYSSRNHDFTQFDQ